MLTNRRHTILLSVPGDAPPTEFRIFTSGKVETTKGTFLFDDAAAKSVMSEYQTHGIDLMIDYDHASLAALTVDPAESGKAAGWFNLEVRNGELWAVNVRWTPPAAEALRAKEWRFVSPAFGADSDGRITDLLNVAITNLPATRRLQPLVAASAGASMDPKLIAQALDALVAGDSEKCMELLKGLIAAAAGGDPDASTEDAPPPAGDGGADETQETSENAPPPADAPAEDPKKKDAAVAASIARLIRLSGRASLVDALAEAEVWRDSHIKLETETKKLAAEREVLESAERRKLCVELVSLGGRAPSTVWADDKATTPKAYLLSMPIADLRVMHADAVKANAGRGPGAKPPKAPANTGGAAGSKDFSTPDGPVTLSASELAECERAGAKPEVYAANKGRRLKRASAKGSV